MILKKSLILSSILLALIIITQSCKKDECVIEAVVVTMSISDVTATTALSGGEVITEGRKVISERGVCWNTAGNPTTDDNKTSDGNGTGFYRSLITGLYGNTKYFVRAYATNDLGTVYGTTHEFVTTDKVHDVDGNIYQTVETGGQVWMAENLKTTKFNDGNSISLVTNNTEWSELNTEAYCWYNNDETINKPVYGALYNWYAVNNDKLCPTDFHVPTDAEWKTLEKSLGMTQGSADIAKDWRGSPVGGKLKATGLVLWGSPNQGATNDSGFTGLPGGIHAWDGVFYFNGINADWWSSTEEDSDYAWYRALSYANADVYRGTARKKNGYSVRCVRDY